MATLSEQLQASLDSKPQAPAKIGEREVKLSDMVLEHTQANTTEPTTPEDPAAGVETALRNTHDYALAVAKAVHEGLFVGYGSEVGVVSTATFRYLLAGPDGRSRGGRSTKRC